MYNYEQYAESQENYVNLYQKIYGDFDECPICKDPRHTSEVHYYDTVSKI